MKKFVIKWANKSQLRHIDKVRVTVEIPGVESCKYPDPSIQTETLKKIAERNGVDPRALIGERADMSPEQIVKENYTATSRGLVESIMFSIRKHLGAQALDMSVEEIEVPDRESTL